jgi:hypothetical protein
MVKRVSNEARLPVHEASVWRSRLSTISFAIVLLVVDCLSNGCAFRIEITRGGTKHKDVQIDASVSRSIQEVTGWARNRAYVLVATNPVAKPPASAGSG